MTTSERTPHAGLSGFALRAVREGFHRHDKAGVPALDPIGAPTSRAHVKLQLNLHVPMTCADYPDEETTWLAMAGQVREVLAPDRVRVTGLVTTTDHAPRGFAGEWVAELVRQPEANYPWMLAYLRSADEAMGCGAFDEESCVLYKIACTGPTPRVAAFLDELAAAVGGAPEDGAVIMSMMVGNVKLAFVVCGTAGDLASSEAELVLVGADAVLFATDDPGLEDAVRARLDHRGRKLATLVHARCSTPALEMMRRVSKQLLSRGRAAG